MTPGPVPALNGVIAVASGAYYSVALKADGTVWTWGASWAQQVGPGAADSCPLSAVCARTPVQVPGLFDVVSVASSYQSGLAMRRDGTVWAWGGSEYGQLGDGTTTTRAEPRPIEGLPAVRALGGGPVAGHSLAVAADGRVWAWGQNQAGQLGTTTDSPCANPVTGAPVACRTSPAAVTGIDGVVSAAAGLTVSLVVKEDGTVWGWGHDGFGSLGDGTVDATIQGPTQAIGLASIRAVAAGYGQSLALRADGTAFGWGRNEYGQTGVADPDQRFVATPSRIVFDGASAASVVGTGSYHSLAAVGSPPEQTTATPTPSPPPEVQPSPAATTRIFLPLAPRAAGSARG